MLKLYIGEHEGWDPQKEMFIKSKPQVLCLEHSLVSLSKWESKYKRPYLQKNNDKTRDEILYYIRCMTITQNVDDRVYELLSVEDLKKINDYISDSMTATWFNDNVNSNNRARYSKTSNKEQITSELIYYWMFSYQIPITCEKWHLNRLLTLIRIFSIKNSEQSGKGNKMSKQQIMSQNRALNAARRKRLGTKG